MSLKEYKQKRDFQKTTEPIAKQSFQSEMKHLEFIVQKHHASHLHYDFRLESEGVLKSWAIPKGPSMNPSDKRLAIQVEDHPFAYRTFEGKIPQGQYGAGIVKIWDKGIYFIEENLTLKENETFIKKGLKEGRLNFILQGEKLKGAFSLIQFQNQRNQWLLIKKKDDFADPHFVIK